jgi:hypothetical protein
MSLVCCYHDHHIVHPSSSITAVPCFPPASSSRSPSAGAGSGVVFTSTPSVNPLAWTHCLRACLTGSRCCRILTLAAGPPACRTWLPLTPENSHLAAVWRLFWAIRPDGVAQGSLLNSGRKSPDEESQGASVSTQIQAARTTGAWAACLQARPNACTPLPFSLCSRIDVPSGVGLDVHGHEAVSFSDCCRPRSGSIFADPFQNLGILLLKPSTYSISAPPIKKRAVPPSWRLMVQLRRQNSFKRANNENHLMRPALARHIKSRDYCLTDTRLRRASDTSFNSRQELSLDLFVLRTHQSR